MGKNKKGSSKKNSKKQVKKQKKILTIQEQLNKAFSNSQYQKFYSLIQSAEFVVLAENEREKTLTDFLKKSCLLGLVDVSRFLLEKKTKLDDMPNIKSFFTENNQDVLTYWDEKKTDFVNLFIEKYKSSNNTLLYEVGMFIRQTSENLFQEKIKNRFSLKLQKMAASIMFENRAIEVASRLAEMFDEENCTPKITIEEIKQFYDNDLFYRLDVNVTPLHLANLHKRTDILKLILNYEKIDLNKQNVDGLSPAMLLFEFLCDFEKTDKIDLIIEHSEFFLNLKGVDFLIKDNEGHFLLDYWLNFFMLIEEEQQEKLESLGFLIVEKTAKQVCNKIKKGDEEYLSPMFLDSNTTSFHFACALNDQEAISILLKKNVDINAKNFLGETPFSVLLGNWKRHSCILSALDLMVSSRKINFLIKNEEGDFEVNAFLEYYQKAMGELSEDKKYRLSIIYLNVIKYTCDQICKIKKSDIYKYEEVLYVSAKFNIPNLISSLLKMGVNVNVQNENFKTPLMVLLETHHGDISIYESVKVIFKNGKVNLDQKDKEGLSLKDHFDKYINSLPRYNHEKNERVIKQRPKEDLFDRGLLSKQSFLGRTQSSCDLSSVSADEEFSNPRLKNGNYSESKEMLKKLADCRAPSKRTEPRSNFDCNSEKKEKSTKKLLCSRPIVDIKRSTSLIFNRKKSVDPISIWFDKALSCSTKPQGFKKIKDTSGNNRVYFDLNLLRKQMSDDDFFLLEEKIKNELRFSKKDAAKGLKDIMGKRFNVYVNGFKYSIKKEMGVNAISRVFFFPIRSVFGPETLWIGMVYDPDGLHSKDVIKSFETSLNSNLLTLNLPKIEEGQSKIIKRF